MCFLLSLRKLNPAGSHDNRRPLFDLCTFVPCKEQESLPGSRLPTPIDKLLLCSRLPQVGSKLVKQFGGSLWVDRMEYSQIIAPLIDYGTTETPTRTLGPIHNTCGLLVHLRSLDRSGRWPFDHVSQQCHYGRRSPTLSTLSRMKKEGHLTGASTAYGTSTASSTTSVASASENSDNGNGTEHAVGIMTQEHISISIPPTSTNSSTEDDFISLSEYGSDWSSFESPTPVTASCDSSHEADHTVMQQPSEGHQERKRGRYAGSHSLQPQHPKPRTTTTASSKPRTTTIKSPAALLKKNKQRRKKYAVILENSKTTATNSSLSTSEVPTFSPAQPEECEPPAYLTPENTLKYKEVAIRKKEYLDKANTSDRKWRRQRMLKNSLRMDKQMQKMGDEVGTITSDNLAHNSALEVKADQYQLDLFILHCMKLRGYLQLTHEFEKKSGECLKFSESKDYISAFTSLPPVVVSVFSAFESLLHDPEECAQKLAAINELHLADSISAVTQFFTWIDKRIIQPELQSKQQIPALTCSEVAVILSSLNTVTEHNTANYGSEACGGRRVARIDRIGHSRYVISAVFARRALKSFVLDLLTCTPSFLDAKKVIDTNGMKNYLCFSSGSDSDGFLSFKCAKMIPVPEIEMLTQHREYPASAD
ncbi:hypothetical protein Pelo_4854 [Pelomyxa schiedti]|nr:hypothetical protein Pelo_4854 [Pelomyxa schiedti]